MSAPEEEKPTNKEWMGLLERKYPVPEEPVVPRFAEFQWDGKCEHCGKDRAEHGAFIREDRKHYRERPYWLQLSKEEEKQLEKEAEEFWEDERKLLEDRTKNLHE